VFIDIFCGLHIFRAIFGIKKNIMKKITTLLGIGMTIICQSCTIFSLHPLYEENDLLEEPELLGLWQDTDEGDEYVSFEKLEDKKYLFRYMEAKGDTGQSDDKEDGMFFNRPSIADTVSFEAGLLQVGDHYFLDLYPYYEGEKDEGFYLFRNFIPTHSFLKIEWKDQQLVMYIFELDHMKNLFEQNRIRIKHEMFEDYIVITASTDELKQFISKYADDKEAFDVPSEFKKINQ
jgi:hypothetical protein